MQKYLIISINLAKNLLCLIIFSGRGIKRTQLKDRKNCIPTYTNAYMNTFL